MNIGLITESTFPPFNRANLRLYRLAKVLVNRGDKVFFISPSNVPWHRDVADYEGITVRQYYGFGRYLYSKIRLIVRGYHLVATILLIVKLNFKNKFDVLHGWNPLAGLAAVLSGKIIGKPVFVDFTDFYSDIALTDSTPLAAAILKKIEFFILKNSQKVIVVSEIMRQRLKALGIDEKKIFIVEDGADKEWFNPKIDGKRVREKLGLKNEEPIIIHHGDIKQADGVDILFQALKKVLAVFPRAKLLILGGKGSDYFENLKKFGRDLGVSDSIIYTGWVDSRDVPAYLAAADIGAMPMRATLNHQCYLSFKLFEYWASGKPVVTTRLEAISKIVLNDINGLIVSPENADELADAFIYLIKNSDKSRIIGANGRRLIEEKYDWDILMKKETKLYEGIGY